MRAHCEIRERPKTGRRGQLRPAQSAILVAQRCTILAVEDTMTLYHCPDCDRIHDEPFEAAFMLLVRCVDCAVEDLLRRRELPAALSELEAA
jgi:hypothetical protein